LAQQRSPSGTDKASDRDRRNDKVLNQAFMTIVDSIVQLTETLLAETRALAA
jgi:hypothetical protein